VQTTFTWKKALTGAALLLTLTAVCLAFGQDSAAPPAKPSDDAKQVNPPPASPQDITGQIQSVRATIRSERLRICQQNLNLTDEQGAKFWPIYAQYQADIWKENDKMAALLTAFVEADKPLTDAQLNRLMNDYMTVIQQKMGIRQSYIKKFSQVVPTRTVARWLQIESKMDTLVKFDLTLNMPLIK
jgi:hypothetical protein